MLPKRHGGIFLGGISGMASGGGGGSGVQEYG